MSFKVNVLVPMAGEGSRFKSVGFQRPKPFIDVGGRPMIEWVFDNFTSPHVDINWIVVIRQVPFRLFDFFLLFFVVFLCGKFVLRFVLCFKLQIGVEVVRCPLFLQEAL